MKIVSAIDTCMLKFVYKKVSFRTGLPVTINDTRDSEHHYQRKMLWEGIFICILKNLSLNIVGCCILRN
jgi:hypothetical protein